MLKRQQTNYSFKRIWSKDDHYQFFLLFLLIIFLFNDKYCIVGSYRVLTIDYINDNNENKNSFHE